MSKFKSIWKIKHDTLNDRGYNRNILFECVDEGYNVVATDGHYLRFYMMELEEFQLMSFKAKGDFTIPRKLLKFATTNGNQLLSIDGPFDKFTKLYVGLGDGTNADILTLRCHEFTSSNYKNVVPKLFEYSLTLDKQDMLEIIKASKLPDIFMEFTASSASISNQNSGIQTHAFDRKYLESLIRSFDSARITIEANDGLTPIKLSVGIKNEFALLMPKRF